MKPGDKIRVTWTDGLILNGVYDRAERGYIILKSEEGNRIVCSPNHVKFEVLTKKE